MKNIFIFLFLINFHAFAENLKDSKNCINNSASTDVISEDKISSIQKLANYLNTDSSDSISQKFCLLLESSTTSAKLDDSVESFQRTLKNLSNDDHELKKLLESFDINSSNEINENFFYNKLIYELRCSNNGKSMYMHHYLLLKNPVVIHTIIGRGSKEVQKEEFSKKKKYRENPENLLEVAKSYLREMRKTVYKDFYVTAVREIKRIVENNDSIRQCT